MKSIKAIAAISLSTYLCSCQPKPLEIEVAQSPELLTISAATTDPKSVFVSASYSFNSLLSLNDPTKSDMEIPENMLLKDAVVTLSGAQIDTLKPMLPGLYGRQDLSLEDGRNYTLTVYDQAKGKTVTASTRFHVAPAVASIVPVVNRKKDDTTINLSIKMTAVAEEDYYFISYHSSVSARGLDRSPQAIAASLASFSPKQLTLLTGKEWTQANMEQHIPLTCKDSDTLLVHIGKIDQDYYEYLSTYKKCGYFINQMTGEPINLPTNILHGLGFFALAQPAKYVFKLQEF